MYNFFLLFFVLETLQFIVILIKLLIVQVYSYGKKDYTKGRRNVFYANMYVLNFLSFLYKLLITLSSLVNKKECWEHSCIDLMMQKIYIMVIVLMLIIDTQFCLGKCKQYNLDKLICQSSFISLIQRYVAVSRD